MKQKMLLIAIIFLFPSIVFSGEIYGTIYAPAKSQMQIQVQCGNLGHTAYIDPNGIYQAYIPFTGECSIQVLYSNKWTSPHQIYISPNPTRYNFAIVQRGNDYILERR